MRRGRSWILTNTLTFRKTRVLNSLSPSISRTQLPPCVCISLRVGGGGRRGKREGASTAHQCPNWYQARSLGGKRRNRGVGIRLHVLPLQGPAIPSPREAQHTLWEAGHQLCFLRNADSLHRLSKYFHYSKPSLGDLALMTS